MFRISLSIVILVVSATETLGDGELSHAKFFPPALPNSPNPPSRWGLEDAGHGHTFYELISAGDSPSGVPFLSPGMIVISRRGIVWCVHDSSKKVLLDIRSKLSQSPSSDDNLFSIAFHPDFSDQESLHCGIFFVFYTTGIRGTHRYVLSKYRVDPEVDQPADLSNENILIEQPVADRHHVGGDLAFGPDGFLYVSVDDGSGDHDDQKNGQKITRNLFSGILRIDVDCKGGIWSFPIRKYPRTGRSKGYFIPADNPFVGTDDALEEFWSIGLRNPHQISFDRQDHTLWVGDVGQDHWEKVVIAERGSNHGWSFREGTVRFDRSYLSGNGPVHLLGIEKAPVYEYEHRDLNNCVIGGYVYRGRQFPSLSGKYLFGDHGSGRIFALSRNSRSGAVVEELLRVPTEQGLITSFGETSEGEILVCLWKWNKDDCHVMRLVRSEKGASQIPELLSQTGLFSDLRALTPAPQLLAYNVNQPLWSDGLSKRRWIYVPTSDRDSTNSSLGIKFHSEEPWEFPTGTVFVKHFELSAAESFSGKPIPIETRVIVRDDGDGIYGVTYRWNEAGTDAILVKERETITLPTGSGSAFQWMLPSRTDCLACHTRLSGQILGVNSKRNRSRPGEE